jgi:adenosylhomocysteine nucleosidase
MTMTKSARLAGLLLAAVLTAPAMAQTLESPARTAVMTAFAPEKAAIVALLQDKQVFRLQGTEIVTGLLAGRPVLLAESGVSLVNASMMAQSLIDHFTIERIVVSGIGGGIDPALHVGDVVAPEEWAQPMESVMMRDTPQGPKPPDWMGEELTDLAPFGIMKPKKIELGGTYHQSFKADPALLAIALKVAASLSLKACASDQRCLDQRPQILVGGVGVSTQSFIDNAKLRDYLFATWHARVTDMESAAVAQVAFVNGVPFIAFRSLSDLAGSEAEDANRMDLFMTLASENAASVVKAFMEALPKR